MKNVLSVLLAAVLVVGLLGGCETKQSGANKTVTLTTVSMFGGTDPHGSVYQANILKFMKENPNVTVEDASATSDNAWKAQVVNDFESGSEADVTFFFTGADAAEIDKSGQVVDLATIEKAYPDYARNISAVAMSQVKEADGKTYAVPLTGYWEGLFCNTDLFQKYNAPLPTNWSNFTKAISIFSQNNVVPIAVALGDIPHYTIEHCILSEGGVTEHSVNPGTDISKVPQSWYDGLGLIKALCEMGAFPANTASAKDTETNQLFITKKAAMHIDGSWFINQISDQTNTTVVPFPSYSIKKNPSDILAGFSSGFYISKKAWNDPRKRPLTVKFVELMTSNDSIANFISVAGGSPAAAITPAASSTPLAKAAADMVSKAKNIDIPIDNRVTPAAWSDLCGNIPLVATGKMSAQDALKEALSKNTGN